MSEERSVDCGEAVISYILTRKKVENINLRVKEDGSVCVSAPNRVPLKFLDDFVKSRYDFIISARGRIAIAENTKLTQEFSDSLSSGDTVSILGKKLVISVEYGDDEVLAEDERLVIRTFDTQNQDYIRKLLKNYFYNSTVALFKALNDEVSKLFFEKYGIKKVPIKIRKMKSRWGSCHVTDGFIVMNERLIHYPIEAVRYVFIHEYAHFIHADHSKSFYSVVAEFMPDYKKASDLLKK